MFRTKIIHIIALAAYLCTVTGCVKIKTWRANRNYTRGAYSKAIDDYRYVATRVPRERQPAINLRLAEAYRLIGSVNIAESTYARAIPRGATASDTIYFGLAYCQLANEKYALAHNNLEKYLELRAKDNIKTFRDSLATFMYDYCRQMSDTLAPKQTRYIVSNAKELNSAKDDFAPSYMTDDYTSIAFTSTREEAKGRKKSIITLDKNADIFTINQMRTGKWEKAMPLKGAVNNKYDNGVTSFSSDFQTIYYTECIAGGKSTGCKLYAAIYDPESKQWNEVSEITVQDSALNDFAHPALSPDGTELYFAGDCDSCGEFNYGGMDIYKMQRTTSEDGEDAWTTPQNLGAEINTAGDEMYPYIHPNGTLYFASNGHRGFGGLDIFKATMQEDRTWMVENMGLPINSSADDFSIVFESEREAGLFASRRKGGRGGDDIYRFVLPDAKFTFAGTVYLKENKKPMADVTINMLSNTGESLQLLTDADGKFSFNIKLETDYLLQVRRKGYFNEKLRFSTFDMDEEVFTLREDFFMQAMDKVIELEDIFYAFGKWDLLPESEASLNTLVDILNDNPAISIVISAHTDMRGTEDFNVELSQKRAQSVVDYLIGKGIAKTRLQAEGMGKSMPRTVTPAIADKYPFLRVGDILGEDFTQEYAKSKAEQDIIDQLNRRTEFRVVE
jgi:peptidoglycan-associated lipoprotein